MFIFFDLKSCIIIHFMKTKALFLDRDGIINIDKSYVYKIEDFEFCEGIFTLCAFFQKKGFKIIVITNQSGIARGFYSEKDFENLSAFMCESFLQKGIKIDKIYHCPHLEGCECRKPRPGMLLSAAKDFNINLKESFFVGDNLTDMEAGLNAGIENLFLIKKDFKAEDKFKVFANLKELLEYLKKEEK